MEAGSNGGEEIRAVPSRNIDHGGLTQHPVAGDYVRASFAPHRPLRGLASADDQAVVWAAHGWSPPHHPWLYAMGAPAAAAQLAVLLTQSEGNLAGATVERAMLDSLPTALRPEGDAWDWWSTARIPRRLDGERAVSITANLDAATAGEIQDLLNVASPGHWAPPGHPTALEWAWVRHPVAGNIVACASHTRQSQDVPHLASVATHPQHRGQGWARVVVAALTRYLLETGSPAVTLGMHADNAAARRVYTDLGFTVKHSWMSGRFPH